MRYELKMCLAVAFLLAMVLSSCRAVPVRNPSQETDPGLQRIIQRLMLRVPQNFRREVYEENIEDIDSLERERRGGSRSNPAPMGMSLVPMTTLRKQYEEELWRQRQREKDQKNQRFFESIG